MYGNAIPPERRAALGITLVLPLLLGALATPAHATLPELNFSAERVEVGERKFDDVELEAEGTGSFRVQFRKMTGPGEMLLGNGVNASGRVESIDNREDTVEGQVWLEALGLAGRVTARRTGGALQIGWTGQGQPLSVVARLPGMPEEADWLARGGFDADVGLSLPDAGPAGLEAKVTAHDVAFDSPDGLYAGESLDIGAQLSWPDLQREALAVKGDLLKGQLLLGDFYRDFADAGLHFEAGIRWDHTAVDVVSLRLADGGAVSFEGRARLALGSAPGEAGASTAAGDSGEQVAWSLEADRLELSFPGAYRRYVEPLAAAVTLDGLEVTGHVVWQGEWQDGELLAGDLQVNDLSVVDRQRQRFAVTGLETHLRPGDYSFDSRLTWKGLLVGPINLGPGSAALDSEPGTLALLRPLELEVLGGKVDLGALRVTLPGSRAEQQGAPELMFRATLSGIDMRQLSRVLGWPEFAGTLSGEIPGVSLHEGVLSMDGQVQLDVFGGRITLRNLATERLFGVLPSLAADISIENLDLDQVTGTFSFGHIAGRLDGYVNNLRLLDWRPVAFDAWLGTPEGQAGSRDISRQAVNRLTTIGGGSATTALAGPFMRMFSRFSYRRLGLGCRLQNNVCSLRGLSDDGASVLILEGAGVPKITIRAFNRSIDWPQMVSNLLAISADNPVQVGARPGTEQH